MELKGHLHKKAHQNTKVFLGLHFDLLNIFIITTQQILRWLAKWVLRWSDNNRLLAAAHIR